MLLGMNNTKLTKRLISLFALAGLASFFTGCNTIEGMGSDIESAGQGIEDAAN
jgi:predicted small secreted protein